MEIESGDAGSPSTSWVVTPSAPLDEGWYALVLSADADAILSNGHARTDGGSEARFRVGSQPLLISVGACASDDLELLPKIILDFSELVTLPTGAPPVDVLADGAPVSCETYMPPDEYGPMGMTCTPPIAASAAIIVTVGSGIVSVSSGLPLSTSAGAMPQSFELPPIVPYIACREWRETKIPGE